MATTTKTNPTRRETPSKKRRLKRTYRLGVIDRDCAYPQHIFCELLGITRYAVRDMRARGLKVRKDGKYCVIVGEDYLEYLRTLPTTDEVLHQQAAGKERNVEDPDQGDGSD